jgi:hypothetical protein
MLVLGLLGGLLLGGLGFGVSQWILAQLFGLVVFWVMPGAGFWWALFVMFFLGFLASLAPATRAYWASVKEGLHG